MNEQPIALRLATWHAAMADEPKRNEAKRQKHSQTADELRRLHSVELNLQRLNENHTDLIMSNRCLRVINAQLLGSLKLAQQWIAGMEPKDKVSGFALICSAIAAASNKTSK